jgi:CarboxypepD_reg-like domain
MNMKKQVLLLAVLLHLTTLLLAQKQITGTVTDERGEPLVGASIVMEGTNQGVLTDLDGKYIIPISKETKKLVFAYIGYEKQVIDLKNASKTDVRLKTDVKILNELVIVGYQQRGGCSYPGSCVSLSSSVCCGCGVYRTEKTLENNKIEAISLENGATKLVYNLNTLHWVYFNNFVRHEDWAFAKNKVSYTISKSTDDRRYKKIGTSESDTKPIAQLKGDSTLNIWGGSQFLDKEPNETDSVYYLVEGFVQANNSQERQLVYTKKIVVPPTQGLKINSLYAHSKSNQLEIGISSPDDGKADFMISDMAGRVLLKEQRLLFKENNTLVLSSGRLISGVYLLSVHQNGRLVNRKFVVAE